LRLWVDGLIIFMTSVAMKMIHNRYPFLGCMVHFQSFMVYTRFMADTSLAR
jgi:hypothetical protein